MHRVDHARPRATYSRGLSWPAYHGYPSSLVRYSDATGPPPDTEHATLDHAARANKPGQARRSGHPARSTGGRLTSSTAAPQDHDLRLESLEEKVAPHYGTANIVDAGVVVSGVLAE